MRRKYIKNRRVVKRFLLFPCIINEEMRWLEFAQIEQELTRGINYKWIWINKNWIDN